MSWDLRCLAGLAQCCPLHSTKEDNAAVCSGWEAGGGCDALLSFTGHKPWVGCLLREGDVSNEQKRVPVLSGSAHSCGGTCTRARGSCLGTWEPPAVFKPHEAVETVPLDADQPRLRSVNLDGSSSPLSFAVCGCHSYEVSLPLIPPLHGRGAQTYFLPGPRNPSPTAHVEVTLRLRW